MHIPPPGKIWKKATYRKLAQNHHLLLHSIFRCHEVGFVAMKKATKSKKKPGKSAMKVMKMMKKPRDSAKRAKKTMKKSLLGQAEAMHGKLWKQWTEHVKRVGPSWLFAAITLSHMFCCRISEILSLQANDFNWRHRFVRIKPLKRQPEAAC